MQVGDIIEVQKEEGCRQKKTDFEFCGVGRQGIVTQLNYAALGNHMIKFKGHPAIGCSEKYLKVVA